MKRALVIGASSGMGREFAQRLADAGWRVGVVGRRETLLLEVVRRDPDRLFYCRADISRPKDAVAGLERLVDRIGGMDLCILAAGTGDLNPTLDFAGEEPAILTNVWGWTAVADWACGYFEDRGSGHLAVITSVGGLRGSGAAPAYNASKAYQINYVEGLRQRIAKSPSRIAVTEIRPGLVATEMAKGDGLFWVMPVEKAVRQALHGLYRRRKLVVVTRRWRIIAWLLRHLPDRLYLGL